MATISFLINGTKRETVPIYVRLSAGRGVDVSVKSGLFVSPDRWSNKTETIKQRITTDADNKLIKKLTKLREFLNDKVRNHTNGFTKEWLQTVINEYNNNRGADATTLNGYISKFIEDAASGERKNKNNVDYASGTARGLRGFQGVFNMYQGIYSEKQLKKLDKENKRRAEEGKPIKQRRPVRKVDFDNINIDFYNAFNKFLSEEGYSLNTQGRFVKNLKIIMKKSLQDGKHTNREFQHDAFKVISVESFQIALTQDELDSIYQYDLSKPENRRLEIARDLFIIMSETAVRVSDCKNITVQKIEGVPCIVYTQQKTEKKVIVPATPRFMEIWNKYGQKLPYIHENYINEYIKTVASLCKIDAVEKWSTNKFGKKYEASSRRYELISCHTARRSAATKWKRAGVSIEDISILLGHSTVKQTMTYLKISQEENALRISKLPYFSQLRAV